MQTIEVKHDFKNPPMVLELEIPRLKQAKFRSYWLPRILSDDKTVRVDWLAFVCPRIGLPVHIIDDKTGEILFWVPPLIKSPVTQESDVFNTCFLDYVNLAENRSVFVADKMIQPLLESVKTGEATDLEIAQWRFILEGYDLLKPPSTDKKATVHVSDADEIPEW